MQTIRDIFLKVDRIVDRLQEYACFIFFFAMVVVGGVSVFSRFVFNLSITWAEEAIRFSCIWLTWVGAALTVRKDGHVSIDIVLSMIKNDKVRAVYYCISRIIGIVFLIILLPASIELFQRTGNSRAAAIPIRWCWIYLAVPVGIVNMLWAYITALPRYTKKQLGHQDNLMNEISAESAAEHKAGTEGADIT